MWELTVGKDVGLMSSDRDAGQADAGRLNRRSFLRSSGGVAGGLAVTVVPGAAVVLASPAAASAPVGRRVDPTGDVPSEPVMAYVHDAEKGEVTVLSAGGESTHHDPVLARRLLDAARTHRV
jgi:hypothetical protein